jgi:hypothetical protein
VQTLVVLKEHESAILESLSITQVEKSAPIELVILDSTPDGQALSTEAGIKKLKTSGSGADIIVSSCDHAIVLDPLRFNRFKGKPECDAAIFTVRGFPGGTRTPASFAWVVPQVSEDEFPVVKKVSVKKAVSEYPQKDHLLVGTFWFQNTQVMQLGIDLLKECNTRVNGELYLDSIFEILIEKGHVVRLIELDGYIGWGDPDSLAESLYWQEIFFGHTLVPRPRYPGVIPHAAI